MPRENSSMNIIMMSDENDQSSRYSGTSFDVEDNLIVSRGYIVNVIVEPDYTYYDGDSSYESDENGQYDELATATGGLEGDITNLTSFKQTMVDITTLAGAASSSFELSNNAISETISVSMDDELIPRSQTNGWDLPVGTNSIVFYGSYVPEGGESIEVVYSYLSES